MPHKVMEYLKGQAPGAEFSSAELAEATDSYIGGFASALQPLRDAGLIISRYKPGNNKLIYWSLGDGVPLAGVEEDDQEHPQREVVAIGPRTASEWLPKPDPAPIKPIKAKTPGPKEIKPRHFRVGLYSDGTMAIEIASNSFMLNKEEARQLCNHLGVDR